MSPTSPALSEGIIVESAGSHDAEACSWSQGKIAAVTGVRMRTVDAFTDRPFAGNPAAVVVLDSTAPDAWMAAVARETNLSDTGFVVREQVADADFTLRWFTRSGVEVDLCGHATLASAHCLFEDGVASPIRFATRSGVLTVVRREDGQLAMDFPASPPVPVDEPAGLVTALGAAVAWTGLGADLFVVALLADEETVRGLSPDIVALNPGADRRRSRHCSCGRGKQVRLRLTRIRPQNGDR